MKLIIDGDLLLHRSCAAVEKEVPVGNHRILMSNFEDARGVMYGTLDDLLEQANTDEAVFAFSDSVNFRKTVYPDYKGNRKGSRKPLCYYDLVEYVEAHFETLRFPGIEADDIMGIYCDRPDYVIWTLDKDLMQCPGLHLIDDEIVRVTEEEGDRFHLMQTLMGDVTDGYMGCPGIGAGTAAEFLENPYMVVEVTRELKSGANKGQMRTTWQKTETESVWEGIVSLYAKQQLTESDALGQAQIARILRDGEYDFEKEEVILWTP